jgi:L-alanine-DL-glutamate epimerase-like enolase superfamily enzyme
MLARGVELLPENVPAARFGLETALLDLTGKRRQTPAWTLFGLRSAPSLPLAAMIGSAADPELAGSAERAIARGITTLKIKVGAGAFPVELAALRALKMKLPPEVALRLDANQSLSVARLGELAELGPEFVEEPVQARVLRELNASLLPLALDESLQMQSPTDLARLLEIPNVRAVVLKPMALGGISRCSSIAGAARERGIGLVVSHLFDGPLALTAAAVLAFEVGSPGLAMGLDRHAGLEAWDCPMPPAIARGRLEGWSGFGLGLPEFTATS